MKRKIASVVLLFSSLTGLTIAQYVERTSDRTSSFCSRFDNGQVEKTIFLREKLSSMRLTNQQIKSRIEYQIRGAGFARNAAYMASVRTCRSNNYKKYSRTRRA